MKVGTRSILFGYHAFWLHPFMVAAAWWKLYGFPWDPRLWLAFFLHDIGYLGKSNMDGTEGKLHPFKGAALLEIITGSRRWYEFSLYHSREIARVRHKRMSRLCYADKLAGCMYPNWLAIGLCKLSGELEEYMIRFNRKSPQDWAESYRVETLKWLKTNYNYNETSSDRTDRRSERGSVTDNGISSLRNS